MNIGKVIKTIIDKLIAKKVGIVDESFALIDIRSLVKIPKRKDFKNNNTRLKKIDLYKKEYLETIKANILLSSVELHSDKLKEEFELNSKLILRIIQKNGDFIGIENYADEKSIVEYEITYAKLQIYLYNINKCAEEIENRLIALNELTHKISKEKPQKKTIFLNEITNLCFSYYSYKCQIIGLEHEIEAYRIYIVNNKNENFKNEEFVSSHLDRIKAYANDIIPETVKTLENRQLNKITSIALLERALEIWTYYNKDDAYSLLGNLKYQYARIKMNTYKKYILDNYKSFEKYGKYLSELESIARVMNEYGDNLIADEDIQKLYLIKYKYKTIDFIKEPNNPFKEAYSLTRDNTEYCIYEQIIQDKIESIITEKNNVIVRIGLLSNESIKKRIIETLIEIFKSDSNTYDIDKILTSPNLLNLLNAFNDEEKIVEYFKKTYVDKNKYLYFEIIDSTGVPTKRDYNLLIENTVTLEDKLPLDTIFRIGLCGIGTYELIKSPLFKLYKLLIGIKTIKEDLDYEYYIPEGIVSIDMPAGDEYASHLIIDTIRSKIMTNTNIYTPSTLKSLNGELFFSKEIGCLQLNEGLEELYSDNPPISDVFTKKEGKYIHTHELEIPSTLRYIDWGLFYKECIDEIIFKNFRNSQFLNNREKIYEMLSNFFIVETSKKEKYVASTKKRIEVYTIKIRSKYYVSLYFDDENENTYLMDGSELLYKKELTQEEYDSMKEKINTELIYEVFMEKLNEIIDKNEKDKKETI